MSGSNMSDAVAKFNSLTGEMLSQASSVPGVPAATTVVPQSPNASNVQHAIALQQFQFQQSLASQQLLAQQQAAAHAVSIKAAADQAAARAAEISRLLKGEKVDTKREKADGISPRREKSESQSLARSPSLSQSSRSKSVSPIRYRHSRSERERYSPREYNSYRGRRFSGYYGRNRDDHGDFYRSSYRRGADRSRGRRYSYYRRSRSRSTSRPRKRRSPSRSRSPRYRRKESPSPCYRRIRSPSPRSSHRKSARGLDRHSVSRSPISSSSLSSSPSRAKRRSPRKSIDRRSLSSARSRSRSTTSLVKKDNGGDLVGSSSENNNASEPNLMHCEEQTTPSREKLMSDRSSSSARSESSSIDHSGKEIVGEPNRKRTIIGKRASTGGGRAGSSTSLDGERVPGALGSSDDEGGPVHIQDSRFNRRDKDDKHGDLGPRVGRNLNQDHKLKCTKNYSLSSEDAGGPKDQKYFSDDENGSTGEDVAQKKLPSRSTTTKNFELSNRHENKLPLSSNEESPYSLDTERDNRRIEVQVCQNMSVGVLTVEDTVNDRVRNIQQLPSNPKVDLFDPNIASEHTGHPLSKAGEPKHERECDVVASVMLPEGFEWVDNAHDSVSPTFSQHMQKSSKRRSRPRDTRSKHIKRHHKRHKREESEEDFASKKESRRERKLKKHRRKAHRRHEKGRKERNRRKRKHRDTSSSSSSEDSSSSDGEYTDVASKRSAGYKKKRGRRSPLAVSASSE